MTIKEFLCTTKLDSTDAQVLVCEICGLEKTQLITLSDRSLTEDEVQELKDCENHRLSGMPLAYIIEHKDFWKLTFYTPEGVLIPRPDTETLVEAACKEALETKKPDIKILDLCAGTGCIGISVADEICSSFENVCLYLSDISPKAYDCFSFNADNLLWGRNIDVFRACGNLFDTVQNRTFDFILTNPPYIETDVIKTLSPEVKSEPALALDGGKDGLDLIKKIVSQAKEYLEDEGFLFMEIGFNQGQAVSELFKSQGFSDVTVLKDLGMNDRVVKGRKPCTKN